MINEANKFKVGDLFKIVGCRDGFDTSLPKMIIGKEVVISSVRHDGIGYFKCPLNHNDERSTFYWKLESVETKSNPRGPTSETKIVTDQLPAVPAVPSFKEGSLEWAAIQLLDGKSVVDPDGDQLTHFHEMVAGCYLGYTPEWKLYVEPPKDYVAKVGTDAWAAAMVLEGKEVASTLPDEAHQTNTECFVSTRSIDILFPFLGEGRTWRLA